MSANTYPALLRALADLIEEHHLVTPYTIMSGEVGIHSYTADAPTEMAAWRRALGASTWRKGDADNSIYLTAKIESLPGSPFVTLYIGKNSCVRRVVGTETVEVPAEEARTETREIVEWDCEPVLAGVAS